MAQAQQAGEPSARQPKKAKFPKFAHVANTKYGMADHYGTGVRQKLGRMRDGLGMVTMSDKRIGKPPRSVV